MSHRIMLACKQFGIDDRIQQAHFVAQLMAESSLIPKEENLSYTARRILQVWPSRFKSLAEALPYERNPEALANKVYGNRPELGNSHPGDGWVFRGRGYIQLTGRRNYTLYGRRLGVNLVDAPQLLLQVGVGSLAAAVFWSDHGCNDIASDPRLTVQDKCARITKKITGSERDWQRRLVLTRQVLNLLQA
ncbi:glycoside hydrolase family 19 protein [Deinococcus cellulosilyticus]|uniref:glycoside hydrolase family 19 protein n=1 Tax=Deinococcus cellulosilyticus TaxID=401558 RepID=UPI001649DFA5|nr:glycoside hydrolase family 19 protein [Deinococcus cellulosilyticus]